MDSLAHDNSHISRLSQLSMISVTRERARKTNIESPSRTLLHSTKAKMASEATKGAPKSMLHLTNALMYGVINSILTIPTMYGYTVILFSHQDFSAFMPALSKLVIFSSVVH
jgi:hypothetical protein